MKIGLKGMEDPLLKSLNLGSLFGGGGGGAGQSWSGGSIGDVDGFFASGGDLTHMACGWIRENGPELFAPNGVAGHVFSNR